MVHRIVILLIFFCANVQAQRFHEAVIVKNDGMQISCLARLPNRSGQNIRFKFDFLMRPNKMNFRYIHSVRYELGNGKTLELEYLSFFHFFEKNNNRQNIPAPEWLEVLERGDLTLYVIREISGRRRRQYIAYHYFVKRENDAYATEIAHVRHDGDFIIYSMEPGNFFAAAPHIEEKIRNREYDYRATDIVDIVREYNSFTRK